MGIFSGLLFYQEYKSFTPVRTMGFMVGLVVMLLGMYTLAQRKNFNKDSEDLLETTTVLSPNGEKEHLAHRKDHAFEERSWFVHTLF